VRIVTRSFFFFFFFSATRSLCVFLVSRENIFCISSLFTFFSQSTRAKGETVRAFKSSTHTPVYIKRCRCLLLHQRSSADRFVSFRDEKVQQQQQEQQHFPRQKENVSLLSFRPRLRNSFRVRPWLSDNCRRRRMVRLEFTAQSRRLRTDSILSGCRRESRLTI